MEQRPRQEVRAETQTRIRRQLAVFGDSVMSRQRVEKWCAEFPTGLVTSSDVVRSGRPVIACAERTKRASKSYNGEKTSDCELMHDLSLSRITVPRMIV